MTRVREAAIRMALGADRGAVARMLLRRGVVLAAIGLARRASGTDSVTVLRND
jgi:ABC-type antimicrobial peptide transport system permease subunit